MQKCDCPHGADIATLLSNDKRWRPLLDGNSHEPIGTRILILERNMRENTETMQNLLDSSQLLRTNVSAMMTTAADAEQRKKWNFTKVIQIILACIAFIQLSFVTFKLLTNNITP